MYIKLDDPVVNRTICRKLRSRNVWKDVQEYAEKKNANARPDMTDKKNQKSLTQSTRE
jgi:hypothetical protein